MEMVELYDRRREKTGQVCERHSVPAGLFRLSVHVWILDKDKLLVQQRSLTSKHFAGLWSQTAGGVNAGESSLQTVLRECDEELGLKIDKNEPTYIGSYARTNDIVDIYLVERAINLDKLVLQESEVNAAQLVTFQEFDDMIASGQVVPSINPSLEYLKNYLKLYKNKQ